MILISQAGHRTALATVTSIFSTFLSISKSIKQQALRLIAGFFLVLLTLSVSAQTQFWSDTFEDAGAPSAGTRTPSTNTGFPSVPYAYYFMRTNGTDLNLQAPFPGDTFTTYQNVQGSKFWAGEDTDRARTGVADPNDKVQQIEWTGINISGKSGLSFKGLFAANRNQAWQNPDFGPTYDFLIVEYKIDGGGWTRAGGFNGDKADVLAGYLREDTNADNVGDGTYLSKTFQEFGWTIAGTGTTLSLRFRVSADAAAAQEFAIDNFRLFNSGTSGPAATAGNVEYFEGATANSQAFTNSATGLGFTLTNKFFIQNVAGYGLQSANPPTTPATGSNFYIDNFANQAINQVNSIKTTNKGLFAIKSFWVYPSSLVDGAMPTNDGTLTFTGKKNGVTVYTFTKSGIFQSTVNLGANYNGFTYVDFSVGTDNSNALIDELEISLGSIYRYIAIDNFAFTATPSIVNAAATAVTSSTATINANVNPSALASSAISFDYSTSSTLASGVINVTATPSALASANTATGVSVGITGLAASTTYYYRAKATNTVGTNNNSAILSFTTLAPAGVLLSTSPTLHFANSTGFADNIAEDGEGGSTAISDINIQTYPINSSAVKITGSPLTYYDTNSSGWTGYPGIISYGDASPFYGWVIKSSDGSNFSLASLNFLDWGDQTGKTFKIEAFDGGSSKGSLSFVGNTSTVFKALSQTSGVPALVLPAAFGNVDEVRIYQADAGNSYIALNDVKVGTAVAGPPAPAITSQPSNSSICSGSTTTFSITASNANSYQWYVSTDGGSNFNTLSNTAPYSGVGSSTLTITSATTTLNAYQYRCIATGTTSPAVTSNAVTLTVKTMPVATATPASAMICSGSATNIALTSNPTGASFSWTAATASGTVNGATAGSGTSIAQTLTGNGTVNYTVIPTLNSCTGSPITVTITVNPNPIATATPASQTIISGGATNIALTSTPTGASFAWTAATASGTVNGASAGSGTSIAQTLTGNGTVNYTVTPTLNGCPGSPTTVAITVNPQATVNSINILSAATSNATSVNYSIVFSTSVTGVDASDFTLTNTGSVDGTIGTPTGSGTNWTVPVNSITGDGSMRLDFTGITGITPNASSSFTSGQVYTFDHAAPTITSITRMNPSPTNAATVEYLIVFSEAVTGVGLSDFTLTTGGAATGNIVSLSGSGSTYVLTIGAVAGTGTLRLDLNSSGTGISDGVANTIATGYTSGQVYAIDNTPAITASGIISALSTTYGTASSTSSFNVSGVNITGGITVSAPAGFEVSTSSGSGFAGQITIGSSGAIATTPIYIRLKSTAGVASSPYNGNVSITSTGAVTQTLATASSTVAAKSITLALNAAPAITKTYDASTTAILVPSNYTLSGVVGLDAVTVTGTAVYDTKTVGTGKTITANTFVLAGADAANYSLTTTTATITGAITIKTLTLALNALPAITKAYNASTVANLASGNYTLTGVVGLDVVNVSGTATYDNVNIGTGKTISVNTFVLAGADAGNYMLSTTSATTTGAITTKTLTLALNAVPSITKTYNGLTTASLASGNYTLTGIVGAETVTVTGTASYDTKTAGTGKTITANTFVLAGADAANYTLSTTTATTTGAITTKAITLALNALPAITKIYNGSTAASLVPSNYTLTGVIGLDAVTVSGTAAYDNANIGTGKTVTANTFVLAGADAANYVLSTTTATTTGVITAKTITLALNALPAITKIYNASTTASLTSGNYTLTGVIGLDAVTVSGTATYDNVNIGTGKTISVNTFVLAGADAGNYMLSTTSATTTGAITTKTLTLALNAVPSITKTYNGLTTASLASGNYTLTGIVGAETVTVTGTASYDTKTAGTGKTITANTFVLAGADAANYTLSTTTATTTGAITTKAITLALNALPAITKIYNGSTAASLVPSNYTLTGVIGLDAVTVSGTATYDNANIGTGKTVTVNTFVLAGADAANYNLTTTTATTTGAITAKTLTLALNAVPAITKTYDGLTTASLVPSNYTLTGVAGGETVTVSGTASYDTKTVGTGKTITANTFVLAGADAANYSLTTTTATTTGAITAKALTLALNALPAITKMYDASATATLIPSNYILTGMIGLDAVTVTGTAAYDTKTVGTGKTITANAFVLAGADAGNYTLSTTTATTTGAITIKTLTLALNALPAITKAYNASTVANLALGNYTLTGVVGLDVVNVSGTALYDNANIGTGKTITVNTFVLGGTDAGNYSLTTTTATTTGAITGKALTLTLNAAPAITKTYDGLTTASLAAANYTLTGVVGGETVTVTGTASYDTKAAGTGKTVTVNTFVLAGADAANYNLTTTTATTTGTIIQKVIAVTAVAKAKIYGALDPALTYTFTPALISGDNFTGGLTRIAGENAGNYVINQGTLTLGGNYQIAFTAANLAIGKRDITVIFEPVTKVYGSADPALTFSTNETLPFGDGFTGSLVREQGENVGDYAINLGTLTLNSNYNLVYATASLTITPKPIVVTAEVKSKTYGDTDPQFTYTINAGLLNGDVLNGSLARTVGENVGNYTITQGTLSGNANYAINFISNKLNINKKALLIKADDKIKGFGANNPPFTASYTGFITGETNAVLTAQPVLSTTALINSPKGTYPISVGGASANNYTITYQNGNLTITEGAITDIILTSSPVYEGIVIGTGFGQLRSVSDNPSATFTYSLVAGAGSSDNALFTISGNVVQVASALDYETKTNYSIRIRSTDQNGLTFEKAFVINLIDVNEAPTITTIGDRSICFNTNDQVINLTGITAGPETNQTPTLTVTSNNLAFFTSLSVTKGAGTLGTLNYKLAPGVSGTVEISVTVNDNGGVGFGGVQTTVQRFILTIYALPLVNISSDKGVAMFKGETAVLTTTGGGLTYSWANANGIVSGQNTAVLTIKPTETTTYTVTATNANGCSEVKSITITVTDLPTEAGATANITNIMSPNGDGVNDTWVVDKIELYPNNSVKIVDRSGRLVYSKKNYDNSWNATLSGMPLAEGTYYYIIDFGDGKTIRKGFVTILREQ